MKIEIPAFTPMLKAHEHLAHGAISIDLGDDVVHVVRCKDCKYINAENEDDYCHFWENIYPAPNNYCNFGEIKDDAE